MFLILTTLLVLAALVLFLALVFMWFLRLENESAEQPWYNITGLNNPVERRVSGPEWGAGDWSLVRPEKGL